MAQKIAHIRVGMQKTNSFNRWWSELRHNSAVFEQKLNLLEIPTINVALSGAVARFSPPSKDVKRYKEVSFSEKTQKIIREYGLEFYPSVKADSLVAYTNKPSAYDATIDYVSRNGFDSLLISGIHESKPGQTRSHQAVTDTARLYKDEGYHVTIVNEGTPLGTTSGFVLEKDREAHHGNIPVMRMFGILKHCDLVLNKPIYDYIRACSQEMTVTRVSNYEAKRIRISPEKWHLGAEFRAEHNMQNNPEYEVRFVVPASLGGSISKDNMALVPWVFNDMLNRFRINNSIKVGETKELPIPVLDGAIWNAPAGIPIIHSGNALTQRPERYAGIYANLPPRPYGL